jgi:6-pyruvoyltetrahydropterin/6-carboxytetrahydropterin synthase
MKVAKRFHFYAAHRNEEIGGKCGNIHGHRYGLEVEVDYPQVGSVSMLFERVEEFVAPLVEALDHSLLLHAGDPARLAIQETDSSTVTVEAQP